MGSSQSQLSTGSSAIPAQLQQTPCADPLPAPPARLPTPPASASPLPGRPCRVQLVSLCRFVGIQPFGTDAFLRGRLRRHLLEIKVGWLGLAGWGRRVVACLWRWAARV